MNKPTLGVVVGKFQTPFLTESHIELLEYVSKKYDKILVVIGSNQIRTEIDLYSFNARTTMISEIIKTNIMFDSIIDVFNKEIWSNNLDKILSKYKNEYSITLCGGRDSFLNSYVGIHAYMDHFESSYGELVSATNLRKHLVSLGEIDSVDFRKGQLYEAFKQYPTAYQTVDAAIVDGRGRILLGRKKQEIKYCLIGGFSEPTSYSLEDDVYKELYEEARIETSDIISIEYVSSRLVDDPRRTKSMHKNKTALFLVKVKPDLKFLAGDDIIECKWFNINDVNSSVLVERHLPIIQMYFDRRTILDKIKEPTLKFLGV